uniref:2',5'-phosphodiesterase 12 n=1 Tax=Aceria tosichella TaxID=561515 RepID=A0A6G1SPJ1_9ACAR
MQALARITSLLVSIERFGTLKNVRPSLRFPPKSLLAISETNMAVSMSRRLSTLEGPVDGQDSVYVQHSEGKEMMTISFEYTTCGKTKSFNLYRKANEPLSMSLERLKLNLMKMKKVKKQKNGAPKGQPDNEDTLNLSIHISGKKLDPACTSNIDAWIEGATMNLDGRQYVIKRNEPQVVLMRLPSIIMKGFITVPDVDLANCNVETCKFLWYRQISAQERETIQQTDETSAKKIEMKNQVYWLYLSEGIIYSPSDDDIAHYLKVVCLPSNGSKVGPTYSCLSGRPVELGPPTCPFEKRQLHTRDRFSNTNKLRIVSYNILADLYADSDYSRNVLFAHCPPHSLEIDYRRQLLLKEIHGYNADIICLQEVDKKEFSRTYEPYFKLTSGHHGLFNTKGGQVAEGVATFFRVDRFELVDSHRTILSKLIDPSAPVEEDGDSKCDDLTDHPILHDPNSTPAKELLSKLRNVKVAILKNLELTKRFMNRHTIIQTTLLKAKGVPRNYVIVANTHLYFAPDADHVRLLQGIVCVKYLEFMKTFYKSMIERLFNEKDAHIYIIFCGDMNSSPDCGLFKLLHEGKVPDDLPDWRSNENESVEGLSVETHLRFSSAYQNIPYTNYTPGFNGWLDYIYYELDGIECESTVPLPDHDDVIANEGIPSDVFPSDHLALIADLKLRAPCS